MLCFDTYALIEIRKGNQAYIKLLDEEFLITDLTIAEFYVTLYKEGEEPSAKIWCSKFVHNCVPVDKEILIKALKYRQDNKKENLSVFDAIGYIFALEHGYTFVTGDKAFEGKKGVLFVK